MDHLAILNGDWLEKILEGSKTVETRWYKVRIPPMKDNSQYSEGILPGEVIYFKQSGKPVTARAVCDHVQFYSDLNRENTAMILNAYGSEMGFGIGSLDSLADRKYAVLIFLRDTEEVEPFNIDKSGYGNAAAWLTVPDIHAIKV